MGLDEIEGILIFYQKKVEDTLDFVEEPCQELCLSL